MRLNTFCEGAHDEAFEASAEQIMLVVSQGDNSGTRDRDNSVSGYSSDAETSEGQETDSISFPGDPSSLSSSSSASASSSAGENEDASDIESEISFLQKKQRLLKRAVSAMKREEVYDATKAHAILSGSIASESSLWMEPERRSQGQHSCGGREI